MLRCWTGKHRQSVHIVVFESVLALLLLLHHDPYHHNVAQAMVLSSSPPSNKEVFSVAPMMAHTNRHYRRMFRLLSPRAFLYTEMIPASQILQVYEAVIIAGDCKKSGGDDYDDIIYHPEFIQESVQKTIQSHYYSNSPLSLQLLPPGLSHVLHELLDAAVNNKNIVLQLGGRDPTTLARAAAIGTAFGFADINLNCGCPSASVTSVCSAGAALMNDADLVARCVEAMSSQMDDISTLTSITPLLSVKHRLAAVDSNEYMSNVDYYDEEHAYQSCLKFCQTITAASQVSKLHVHARLALLGLGTVTGGDSSSSSTSATEEGYKASIRENVPQLWTPNNKNNHRNNDKGDDDNDDSNNNDNTKKVDHKRLQYQLKRMARQATIHNRSIPPLRPTIVEEIAKEFAPRGIEVISNGGINTVEECRQRLQHNDNNNLISGVMVGRAAINHPCSFASVDRELWGVTPESNEDIVPTRRKVLESYIEYCTQQEQDLLQQGKSFTGPVEQLKEYRKRLVAAPFHLFMGEDGNNAYQRRLRKLASRGDRYSSVAMLQAAMSELETTTATAIAASGSIISPLDKKVTEHVPLDRIESYDFTRRSGAMQRAIH